VNRTSGPRQLSRRQELQGAGNVAAELVEKREVVAAGDAERPRHRLALAFFREEAAEERSAFAAGIRLRALGQRGRQGRGVFTLKPVG